MAKCPKCGSDKRDVKMCGLDRKGEYLMESYRDPHAVRQLNGCVPCDHLWHEIAGDREEMFDAWVYRLNSIARNPPTTGSYHQLSMLVREIFETGWKAADAHKVERGEANRG